MNRSLNPRIRLASDPDRHASCSTCPLGAVSLPRCPFHDAAHAAGEVLVVQGEVPQSVLYVKEGSVLVSSVGPGGDETVCGFRGPGSLLGLELLDNVPADYQAWALTPSIVCALSAPAFAQWIGTLDSPMGAVLRLALREASRRREERVALAGRTVERLARFLLERRRIDGRDVPLEVQHQVLARMLGMRAETLSRAIAALRRKGVLARGRELTVADPARLAEVARAATT